MPSHLYDMRFWFSRGRCLMEMMVGLLNQTRSCISDNFDPIASRLTVLLTSCIYCHRSAVALLIVEEMRGCSTLNPPPHPHPNDPSLVLIKKRGAVREVGQKAPSWFCSSEAGAANKHTAHIVTVTHFLLGPPPLIFCYTHIDTHDYPSCRDADLPQVACCSVSCSYWRHLT